MKEILITWGIAILITATGIFFNIRPVIFIGIGSLIYAIYITIDYYS